MAGDATALNDLINGYIIASQFYSSRRGTKVRLIVFHTAEGARTNSALGRWFQNSSANVSSHVGIDDDSVARFVPEAYSAWAAGNANPHATQAELCGFAAWSVAQWNAHPVMLELAARWAAAESIYHGIPLVRVRGAEVTTKSGVAMHIDCTRGYGGTHVDCGTAFSDVVLDRVIARAREIVAGHTTTPKEPEMDLTTPIRDANPFRNAKSPEITNFGNVTQDIQANAGFSAREGHETLLLVKSLTTLVEALRNEVSDLKTVVAGGDREAASAPVAR